jgi:hypothetical protein
MLALPVGTYLISLPIFYPFYGGIITDLKVVVFLPLIGLGVCVWGTVLKNSAEVVAEDVEPASTAS